MRMPSLLLARRLMATQASDRVGGADYDGTSTSISIGVLTWAEATGQDSADAKYPPTVSGGVLLLFYSQPEQQLMNVSCGSLTFC